MKRPRRKKDVGWSRTKGNEWNKRIENQDREGTGRQNQDRKNEGRGNEEKDEKTKEVMNISDKREKARDGRKDSK